MKTPTDSRIFMLAPAAFTNGQCGVCGEVKPLRFRDLSTGCVVGFCCVGDLVIADKALTAGGLRHPTPNEVNNE